MSTRMPVWQSIVAAVGGAGLLVGAGYAVYARIPDWEGHLFWISLAVLPIYVVAVWLVRRRPHHPQAHRLLLIASSSAVGIALESTVRVAYQGAASAGWLWAVNLVHQYTTTVTVVASAALLATYPDGVVERRWQAWVVRLIWWQLVLPPLLLLCRPELLISPYLLGTGSVPSVASPFAVAGLAPVGQALEWLYASYAPIVAGVLLMVVRYAGYGRAQRRRMRLLVYAMVVALPPVLAYVVMTNLGVPGDSPWFRLVETFTIPAVLMIPISIVIGVLRHRLFDIDLVVRRSVAYGALTVVIACGYIGLAAAPGLALGEQIPVEFAVVLTVLAAVAFQPLRRRLESLADRWVFGERINRYQLLTWFGATVEQIADLAELLPRLATAVRLGLGAPWVRVLLRAERPGSWLAEPRGVAGTPAGDAGLIEVLSHAGEVVGRIECGRKDTGYDGDDRELLSTLSVQAATAIANVRLTAHLRDQVAELARSRARIVSAADSERRRIERDIHDGVQQEVVALLAKLRLARNRIARGDDAVALLAEAQHEAGELLVDLRELAHGIHPPVLTDGGLLAAVEARIGRLPLDVTVRADEALRSRRFRPDVEAAAYFVVCEALTNVVKHARAGRAQVDIAAVDGRLSLLVGDDGTGDGTSGGAGQGVTNMRDRVEALGGHFRVDCRPCEGTRVSADLPLEASDA